MYYHWAISVFFCALGVLQTFAQVPVGKTLFDKMFFYQDTLYASQSKKFVLTFTNTGNTPIRLLRYEAVDYIKVDLPPQPIMPQQSVSFVLVVYGGRIERVGHFQTLVKLHTNEDKEAQKTCYVSGILRPERKTYTAEVLKTLPQIEVEPIINVGKITSQKPIKVAFTLKNIGFAPLHILNIKTECECTTLLSDTLAIAPQQQKKLQFELNVENKNQPIHSLIWLWTNAANMPEILLTIKGTFQ